MAGHRSRRRRGADAADAGDLLSILPDDILRRILFFVPSKEAASTSVLSRRWRTLWRTSGAVNLDSRSYSPQLADRPDGGRRLRRRFLRDAEAAIAAAAAHGGHITQLTVHVKAAVAPLLNRRRLRAVFSHPEARRVEEFHATVEPVVDIIGRRSGIYKLSLRKLPSENLRVLRITNFNHLKPPESGAAFPQLAELHLKGCMVTFGRLQCIVDAAPQLTTLHLDASSFFPSRDNVAQAPMTSKFLGGLGDEEPCYRLMLPTVTNLIFKNYTEGVRYLKLEGGLEIEAQRLLYIRYHGILLVRGPDKVLLRVLAASNVIQADLHVIVNRHYEKRASVPFWQFVNDFSVAKVLRLKMDFPIEDVGIVDERNQWDDLLGDKFFGNLERLELEGCYGPASRAAAVTIANFLHYCPVVRDLCLKMKMFPIPLHMNAIGTQSQLDFNMSIDRFKCRRRGMVSLGGDDDGDSHKVSDIPGLSEHSFDCLQSSLRRVSLQFWMEEPNCFGVQLVKFFTNNAVLLEEMQINDGIHMMSEHINSKIQRWVPAKRRNPLTVTSFGESYQPRKRQKR
ncbi:unnamed protein product [Urochloa humidicola]